MIQVPRIGIDAMGGDFGPQPVAEGAALALREWPGRFRLTPHKPIAGHADRGTSSMKAAMPNHCMGGKGQGWAAAAAA